MTANRYEVSSGEWRNVLKLDLRLNYSVNILKTIELHTLNGYILENMNYISINHFFKEYVLLLMTYQHDLSLMTLTLST